MCSLITMLQIEPIRSKNVGIDETTVDETGVDELGCYPCDMVVDILNPVVERFSYQETVRTLLSVDWGRAKISRRGYPSSLYDPCGFAYNNGPPGCISLL